MFPLYATGFKFTTTIHLLKRRSLFLLNSLFTSAFVLLLKLFCCYSLIEYHDRKELSNFTRGKLIFFKNKFIPRV